jgi:predicted DNA-binding ArsR family transcriptional regulator
MGKRIELVILNDSNRSIRIIRNCDLVDVSSILTESGDKVRTLHSKYGQPVIP